MENYTDNQLVSSIQRVEFRRLCGTDCQVPVFHSGKGTSVSQFLYWKRMTYVRKACLVYSVQPEATIRIKMPALKHMRVFVFKTALWRYIVPVRARRTFLWDNWYPLNDEEASQLNIQGYQSSIV